MQEYDVNLFLQQFSNKFLDCLNLLITQFGDEIFFIGIAIVLFWCVDKKYGFKLMNVYLLSCVAMASIKSIVKRPRPFENTPVKSIGEKTDGYSFPSGHSHSVGSLTTQLSMRYKKRSVLISGIALTLAVMISRLYLGQHYISDVLVGCALGVGMAFLLTWLYGFVQSKEDKLMYVIAPLCVVIAVVCSILNVHSENLYTVCGAYAMITVCYTLEKKYIGLNPETSIGKQIIKIVTGSVSVLATKELLKLLFVAIGWTHPLVYCAVRYAAVVFVAMFLMPLVFKKLHLENVTAVESENFATDKK